MCKLVPYWGMSAQPGSTYYLQKLNHDILGIMDHSCNSSTVYLFDEWVGQRIQITWYPSYLTDFISKLPDWIHRIHFFPDNTSSTNKNFYDSVGMWDDSAGKIVLPLNFIHPTPYSPGLQQVIYILMTQVKIGNFSVCQCHHVHGGI